MNIKKIVHTLAIIAGSAALAAQTGFAQPSSISITNAVVGTTNAVWDFSQLTNEVQTINITIHKIKNGQTNTEVAISYADPYAMDGRGRLAGGPEATTVSLANGDNNGGLTNAPLFQGTNTTRGSVSGTKGIAHLLFTSKVTGLADLEGSMRHVSASAIYSVKLDANASTNQITGHRLELASASGLGSISESSTFSDMLPPDLGDGTWTLVLNFTNAPSVTKLGGDATVTLQSGQVYPFTFTGVFAPHGGTDKLGQSQVNLKGHDAGLGCILQGTLNSSNSITRIVGRIAGQTVNIKQ